ncbi:MAG: hypothetical protein WD995_14135 [Gemmatimonadota bacterium]
MARFLVLPRDPPGAWDDVSPSEMQRIVEKYMAWSSKLGAWDAAAAFHEALTLCRSAPERAYLRGRSERARLASARAGAPYA